MAGVCRSHPPLDSGRGRSTAVGRPRHELAKRKRRKRERGAAVAEVVEADRLPALTVQARLGGRVLDGAKDVATV
jgi:hypothetical protein